MRIARTIMAPARPPPAAPDVADRLAQAFILLRRGATEQAVAELTASLAEGARAPLVELARHCVAQRRLALGLQILGIIGRARPGLLDEIARDAAFAPLRDDPRFLQLTGRL